LFYLLEKLFDIARRVPFLAMTILEKNGMDSPWLFRTQPLQTSQAESMREVAPDLSSLSTAAATIGQNHSVIQHEGQQLQRQHHQQPSQVQTATTVYTQQNYPYQQQQQQKQQQQPRSQQTEHLRHGMPTGTAVMNTQQNQHQQLPRVQTAAVYTQQSQRQQQQQQQHRLQQIENLRHGMPIGTSTVDPKKVVKSSTAPNLPTSNSLSEMFRVI
jgi:hypothetical protein